MVDDDGNIVEAQGRGVVRDHVGKYTEKHYVVEHTGADPEDVKKILRFAAWGADNRAHYGYLTIASRALTMVTGAKFTFFVDGEFICSGFVARAMERTGAVFNRDPVHVMPADLAKYYQVDPPASAHA